MNIIIHLSYEGIRSSSIINASCLLGVMFFTENEKSPLQFDMVVVPCYMQISVQLYCH
jgi:hypothetical protein